MHVQNGNRSKRLNQARDACDIESNAVFSFTSVPDEKP